MTSAGGVDLHDGKVVRWQHASSQERDDVGMSTRGEELNLSTETDEVDSLADDGLLDSNLPLDPVSAENGRLGALGEGCTITKRRPRDGQWEMPCRVADVLRLLEFAPLDKGCDVLEA